MNRTARLLFLIGLLGWGLSSLSAESPGGTVYYIEFKQVVTRASADFLLRALSEATQRNAEAFVVLLDTPGGELQSTRDITSALLNSPIPTVVFVYPTGARAGSAGVFITISANIAAMAPGTNIGAATPVAGDGQDIPQDMRKKVLNDTIAYARTIARQRGRNEDWVVKAVTEAASIPEGDAKQLRVIDLIANSPSDLLKQINGRTVTLSEGKKRTLRTANAPLQEIPMNWRERLLVFITHPNVFYFLFLIALYGIITEVQNPGLVFPGVIGVISLLLALYAMSVLPVSALGVALILLAFALFVLELFTPTHGALSLGAIISFAIGSMILIQSDSPFLRVSLWLVGVMTALTGGFFLFATYSGVRAQFRRKVSGQERLIGMIGQVRQKLDPIGQVFVDGTLWRAVALEPPIEKGAYVQVERVEGLTLYVTPAQYPTETRTKAGSVKEGN